MMKYFLIFFFSISSNVIFSQDFAYSFKGNLTSEQQNELITKIQELPTISSCKLLYKSDSEKGEVLIHVLESTSRVDSETEYSPSLIKSLFISMQLDPLDYRRITKN